MAGVSTQEFTSAAFIFSSLAANVDCRASDPRKSSNITEGKPCRGVLVTTAGTLDFIRIDGTTVDNGNTVPAGCFVPCQAGTVLASSTAQGWIFW